MEKAVKLLLAVLIMFSCQDVKELTPQEKEVISNEVKQASTSYWELSRDLTRENYEICKSYYDRNFESLWQTEPVIAIFNLNYVKSYDEFFKKFDEIFVNRASVDFIITNQFLSVLSKDVVVEVIEMDYSITSRTGETFGPFETVFTCIWHKSLSGWKYFHVNQAYRKKIEE